MSVPGSPSELWPDWWNESPIAGLPSLDAFDGTAGGGHVPQVLHDEERLGNDEGAQGALTGLQEAGGAAAGLPSHPGPQGLQEEQCWGDDEGAQGVLTGLHGAGGEAAGLPIHSVSQGLHEEGRWSNDEGAQGALTGLQGAGGAAAELPFYPGPQGAAAGGVGGGSASSFDVNKLSYKQPLFQEMIRALLQTYTKSPHDEYAGAQNHPTTSIPHSLEVFKSNLSYSENFLRQLRNSDELVKCAYILDDNNPHAKSTPKPQDEPSNLNLPGKVQGLQMLQQTAGERQLCCLGCDWKGPSKTNKNPQEINVWVFYDISEETADEVNRLKKIKDKDKFKEESTASSFNAKKDLGPGLYVVLPIGVPPPVKRERDQILHEFTTGLIKGLQNERGFLRSTRQRGGKLLPLAFA